MLFVEYVNNIIVNDDYFTEHLINVPDVSRSCTPVVHNLFLPRAKYFLTQTSDGQLIKKM